MYTCGAPAMSSSVRYPSRSESWTGSKYKSSPVSIRARTVAAWSKIRFRTATPLRKSVWNSGMKGPRYQAASGIPRLNP